jgi:putative tricarboxylic transport membrane protein
MRLITKAATLGFASLLALSVSATSFSSDAAAAWKPQKPVEFVIMAGKGGGADRLARFIQGIIKKHRFASLPFVPINKGGGSGAEALRYVRDKAGDPHVIMATLNSYYTTPLRNPGLGVDISKFTPIARMAEDTFQLWVHSDTSIKNVKQYVSAVKKAGMTNWKMGGTGKGAEDSLVTAMLEKTYGFQVTYIPFKGGGTVAKQLIGKHINSTVNNPSEQMGFFQAGKSRPLATFTPNRLKVFPNVPTFRELGHDLVYFMQRSVIAPPGISKEAQAYYVGVFKKVYQSEEWQSYLTKKGLLPGWLTGDKLTAYFIKEKEAHRKLLVSMGEIK